MRRGIGPAVGLSREFVDMGKGNVFVMQEQAGLVRVGSGCLCGKRAVDEPGSPCRWLPLCSGSPLQC